MDIPRCEDRKNLVLSLGMYLPYKSTSNILIWYVNKMWNSNSVSVFYSRWYTEIYHTITFNVFEFIWISWCSLCPSHSRNVANVPDYIWFERVLKDKKLLCLRNMTILCQSLKCICIAFQIIYMPCEKSIVNEYSTKYLYHYIQRYFIKLKYSINCSGASREYSSKKQKEKFILDHWKLRKKV